MNEIERPLTLADLLADPDLFRASGTRLRARHAYANALWRAAHADREGDRQSELPALGSYEADPAKVTLADFVRRVDRWTLLRTIHLGRVLREELERGLEKHGYRLVDDLRAPEVIGEGRVPLTRDALLARMSDLLRRTGAPDASALAAETERRIPETDPPTPQRGGWVVAAGS